jgi:hypothetical protein
MTTVYEKERLARIKEHEEKLSELGLVQLAEDIIPKKRKAPPKKKKEKGATQPHRRKSLRGQVCRAKHGHTQPQRQAPHAINSRRHSKNRVSNQMAAPQPQHQRLK